MPALATLVRSRRKARKLSQFDLAVLVDCTTPTISAIENGQKPHFDLLRNLLRELEIDYAEISSAK